MNVNEVRSTSSAFSTQAAQTKNAAQKQDKAPDVKQTAPGGHRKHAVPKAGDGSQQNEVLTGDEKKYFEQLFPNSASEIRSYRAYTNDGKPAASASGTLIDRKG